MRQVISLSLPGKQATKVKSLARQRGYKSVSNYIHYLIQSDAELISEAELLRSVKKARSEYRQGKVIRANSLDELL